MNPPKILNDKVAVVTGAARGIGRAIAIRLASEGARVAVTARTRHNGDGAYAGSLQQTVEDISAVGGKAVPIVADLANPADRASLITEAQGALGGPVQILVNNAAATRNFELRFTGVTAEEFHRQVDVNVWAGWELSQYALAGMTAAGAGWILNISSQGAAPKIGPPYRAIPMVGAQCLYGSTKAMLDRLTTGAAMELWPDGIAVNALAPEAAVATENASAVAGVRDDYSEPVECFAEAALALCSGEPGVMTGRVATSLSLLVELGRPVRTLDGSDLVSGWQPAEIDRRRLVGSYLAAFCGGR
ncbi:SDR family NAD(P)-dependent oxidoreductase [Mycobacterium sp. NPDC051804]|uniref:SDR family NAD(P)-dependent oxidoreductase n=1 Tax=Mycobacterium sp. NPDC051804 TaxID=3364295 RepID=UPI00378DACAE